MDPLNQSTLVANGKIKRNWDYYIVGLEERMQTEEDMLVLGDMEKTVAVVQKRA